jgi:hypothetical protein
LEESFENGDNGYVTGKEPPGNIINDYIRGLCLIRRKVPGIWDDADLSVRQMPGHDLVMHSGVQEDNSPLCSGNDITEE